MLDIAKVFLLATAVTLPAGALASGDAVAGRAHYAACQACHGASGEGNRSTGSPRLAGQYAWYVARELGYYRDGIRGAAAGDSMGAVMAVQARLLPDRKAVEDVAAYVETLEAPAGERTESRGDAVAGKSGYLACQYCHGERGQGSTVVWAPRLARQHDWYLLRQIGNFRAGLRGTHADDGYGQGMRAMAQTLAGEQAILDVVAYIKTLP